MSISVNLSEKDGWDLVEYHGPIDAEAEIYLDQLHEKLGNKIRFNFKNINFVNSCGVRSWINFMRELEKTPREIEFENCTSEIVMQINMIPSFKGKAKIKSVFGTYICDECGHEKTMLFEEGKDLPSSGNLDNLPEVSCENCSSEMELEEMEEEYFAFLSA